MGWMSAIGGALGGIGGALVGGPIGAVAGASLGAGLGGAAEGPKKVKNQAQEFVFDPEKFKLAQSTPNRFEQQYKSASLGGNLDQAQLNLLQSLQSQASGKTPSVAEQQLRAGTEQNIASLNAALAGQRGMNPAAAQRALVSQAAQANIGMNQQAAILRAQEQQQAQAQLGQMLGQQAQMQQQLVQYYQGLGFESDKAQLLANMQLQQAQAGEAGRVQGLRQNVSMQNAALANQQMAGLLSAGSTIGASLAGGLGK